MVVCCGPTYLRRLWCIIEIFTFVHMGRPLESLEFEMVLREEDEVQDLRVVEAAFDEFNTERCSCFNAQDKERMLNVVYAAFGSIPAFNHVVCGIFRDAKLSDTFEHEARTRTNRERTAGH